MERRVHRGVQARLLIAAALLQGCGGQPPDRFTFEAVSPATDEGRRVVAVLTRRQHWEDGLEAIRHKIGPFPPALPIRVSFDGSGDEFGQASAGSERGWVRFNLPRLEDYQRKVDEIERRRLSLEREGKKAEFRVPPARLDRVVWHELVHVLQRGLEAPDWFREGMAVWVSEDPNALASFARPGRVVERIDAPLTDPNDPYARGHLFWMWLEALGFAQQVAAAAVLERRDWKAALTQTTGLDWEKLVATERDWSAREAATRAK